MINSTELRRALRALKARPWFTIGATVSLAFGIGANTTVFTMVNAILFRPLPYPAAERLVFVHAANQRLGVENGGVSLDEVEVIRRDARSLTGTGVVRESEFNLTVGDRAHRARGAVVSAATLATLGLVPMHGAMFVAGDDAVAAPARVIISDRLWRSALGGTPGAIGGSVRVDGAPFEVIGVMPPGFGFPDQSDLWIPIGAAGSTASRTPSSHARAFQIVARLREGAQESAARAELAALGTALDGLRPASDRGWSFAVVGAEAERGANARPAVYLLFALVTSVLLVACANLATLLAARAAGRQRELAIRSALGASRAQLVWHGLVESIVLAGAGALLSLLITTFGVRAVRLAFPVSTLPFWLRFEIDWRVVSYSLGMAIVTVLAFGLGPAVWSARRAPAAGLVHGSRSATGSVGRGRLSGALIVGQLAVSLVLVVTASLLATALRSMATSELGYEPDGLVTAEVEPRGRRYVGDDASRGALYATLAANVGAIPGVASVTGFDLWGAAPIELSSSVGSSSRRIDGPVYSVLPRYFETLRVRLIAGRSLAIDNGGDGDAAVVNETFARRHWPNASALGRQVRIVRPNGAGEWLTVVGVVGDVRRNPADLEREPHLYVSALRHPPRRLRLVARAEPAAISGAALERAARNADPDEPLGPPVTMRDQISEWTAPSRFFGGSLAGFAAVAVIIAITGVVGVVAGVVTARTREFGIRMALGASPTGMVRLAIGRAARMAVVGAVIGLLGSVAVGQVLVTLPFGVERIDVSVVLVAALMFVAVALVAAWVPARRAGRVEPTIALSHDA